MVCPTVREATPADRPALVAMLERCSPETRVRRFGGHVHRWPEPFLTDCLDSPPERHDALVLTATTTEDSPGTTPEAAPAATPGATPGTTTVTTPATATGTTTLGLATAARLREGVADISLLIEDAWQGHGLVHLLLGTLLDRAAARGVRRLAFQINADQTWLLALARPHLRVVGARVDGTVLLVEALLEPVAR